MEDCIFCKIIAGDIPADILFRDEEIMAVRDVNPVAPTHILVIPLTHMVTTRDIPADSYGITGKMIRKATELAEQEGIADGYRLVINCGEQGGQVVPHLHVHLIGGRRLSNSLG
jgi:histidine triad (HIT) family protein